MTTCLRQEIHSDAIELKTVTRLLWILLASESVGKEGCYSVGWTTDPDNRGEVGLLFHKGGTEEYV